MKHNSTYVVVVVGVVVGVVVVVVSGLKLEKEKRGNDSSRLQSADYLSNLNVVVDVVDDVVVFSSGFNDDVMIIGNVLVV